MSVATVASTICEDHTELTKKHVLYQIVSRIKRSRYYSVTLDAMQMKACRSMNCSFSVHEAIDTGRAICYFHA